METRGCDRNHVIYIQIIISSWRENILSYIGLNHFHNKKNVVFIFHVINIFASL